MAGLTQQKLQGEDNPRWRHDQKKKRFCCQFGTELKHVQRLTDSLQLPFENG